MSPVHLIHLGDLHLTVSLAGAVFAWLMIARSYRLACWWCVLFCCSVSTVAASKILYLAWGIRIDAVDFKAASGHAAGAAAVWPIVLYLLASGLGRTRRDMAFSTGVFVSIVVAAVLVTNGEHTASEAIAGWCFGMMASGMAWSKMRGTIIRPSFQLFGAAFASTVIIATCMQWAPMGWWMIKIARMVSGEQRTHAWGDC
jgi:hypothetical protein